MTLDSSEARKATTSAISSGCGHHAAQLLGREGRLELVAELVDDRRADAARRDGDGADAVLGQLVGGGAGEGDDGGLGGAVGEGELGGLLAVDRGGADDHAAGALVAELAARREDAVVDAVLIDADHRRVVDRGVVVEQRLAAGDARVVEDDVELAEHLDRVGDGGLDLGEDGDVDLPTARAAPAKPSGLESRRRPPRPARG